jgi:hypothetical protein
MIFFSDDTQKKKIIIKMSVIDVKNLKKEVLIELQTAK